MTNKIVRYILAISLVVLLSLATLSLVYVAVYWYEGKVEPETTIMVFDPNSRMYLYFKTDAEVAEYKKNHPEVDEYLKNHPIDPSRNDSND